MATGPVDCLLKDTVKPHLMVPVFYIIINPSSKSHFKVHDAEAVKDGSKFLSIPKLFKAHLLFPVLSTMSHCHLVKIAIIKQYKQWENKNLRHKIVQITWVKHKIKSEMWSNVITNV